jgi:hypothetical protein
VEGKRSSHPHFNAHWVREFALFTNCVQVGYGQVRGWPDEPDPIAQIRLHLLRRKGRLHNEERVAWDSKLIAKPRSLGHPHTDLACRQHIKFIGVGALGNRRFAIDLLVLVERSCKVR